MTAPKLVTVSGNGASLALMGLLVAQPDNIAPKLMASAVKRREEIFIMAE